MKPLSLTYRQKKRASTLMALGVSEFEAVEKLLEEKLYRETVVHLYFTCFYVSQALLANHITTTPSHKHLEAELHRRFGRRRDFPRRYVRLHSFLHNLRTEFDYKTTHTPDPDLLQAKGRVLAAYVRFALRVVPRVDVIDIIRGLHEEHPETIRDFSFDVYCPRTYAHHTRLTVWQPPFYLDIFTPQRLGREAQRLLGNLRVRRAGDYVVGLNSRMNQYRAVHLVMLDIDSVDPGVEAALKPIGGILLKSGRGFHFIGRTIQNSEKQWASQMLRLKRHRVLKKHVDQDHIEISLKRGYATLRITGSPAKPHVPFFYKEL
jgi:uncharacterized protein (UPF0332 family)